MSSAFDTIKREPLMKVLGKILNEDDLRTSRVLLSNTSFCIKLGKHGRDNVKANKSYSQGDGISGTFLI